MKKTLSLLCALALMMLAYTPAQGAQPPRRLKARVTRVYDGASFQLGGGLRSALIGVAAPAPGAPGASQAHAYLKRLIENRTVSLEIDEKPVDASGQTLYYVFLEEGGLVNELMVLRGLGRALVKHPNVRYREKLIEAENLARRYRRGVWGNDFDPRDLVDR
ncbi:MAG: thermonuclease family protein [Nitrospinae bacterium]|nr:thermonuclease family protein [Nitrospinota bacterium]